MFNKINTLLGAVEVSRLGMIYPHEHILTNPPESRMKIDPDYKLDSEEKIIEELNLFHKAGGNTIIDCTALDYGRDAKRMISVAKQVPVHILALTGFNRGDYEPWVKNKNAEELSEMMINDITVGMDGTEAKAALIKIGTNYNNILPIEREIIKAAGIAYEKTGIPVITHTTLGTMGIEQVELLEKEKVNPNHIALSHLDQNLDFYYLNEIASRGAYIIFDGPSKIKYAPDSLRIDMLKALCDAGHEDRILISGDMGRKSYLTAYGGGPGFGFLLEKFIPRLLKQGFDDKLIDKFFKINPVRYLSAK